MGSLRGIYYKWSELLSSVGCHVFKRARSLRITRIDGIAGAIGIQVESARIADGIALDEAPGRGLVVAVAHVGEAGFGVRLLAVPAVGVVDGSLVDQGLAVVAVMVNDLISDQSVLSASDHRVAQLS